MTESRAKVKLELDRDQASQEVEDFKEEAAEDSGGGGGFFSANVSGSGLVGAAKGVLGGAAKVFGAGAALASLLPGSTQAPQIVSDALFSNTKSVYAKAEAVDNASQETADLFAAAGNAADPDSILNVFDSLNKRGQREATGKQRVKKILAERRAEELGGLAGEAVGAIQTDVRDSLQNIEGLIKAYFKKIG